jgi:hypothetical protein
VPRPGFEVQTDPRKWVFGFGRRVSVNIYPESYRLLIFTR